MAKRFIQYTMFAVTGCILGFIAAKYLKEEHYVSNNICLLVMALISAIFILAGHLIVARGVREEEDFPEEIVEEPTQNQARTDGIWGWVTLRQEALKSGYPLAKERIIVGRDVKSDIMLNDDSVSRQHAEIVRTAAGYFIRDLGSKNGTYVNNQRMKESPVRNGDTVNIGSKELNIKIYMEIEPPEPVPAPSLPDLGEDMKDYEGLDDLELPSDENDGG